MIVNKYKYGGGGSGSGSTDLSGYWNSAETQVHIDSAVTPVSEHLFDVEQVTASALTELHDGLLEVSARTVDMSGYYTSGQTDAAISAATSGKADSANLSFADTNPVDLWFPRWNEQGIITGKTGLRNFQIRFDINGMQNRVTSPDNSHIPSIYAPTTSGNPGDILVSTGNGAPVWSAVTGSDMSGYWNSAETKSYVDSAATNLQDQIDTMDDVVAAALVDLNGRVDEISGATPQIDLSGYTPTSGFSTINGSAITSGGNLVIQSPDMSGYYTSGQTDAAISAATQDMVTSTDVRHIVKLTQAAYDQLVLDDDVDPYTFYIIVNSN